MWVHFQITNTKHVTITTTTFSNATELLKTASFLRFCCPVKNVWCSINSEASLLSVMLRLLLQFHYRKPPRLCLMHLPVKHSLLLQRLLFGSLISNIRWRCQWKSWPYVEFQLFVSQPSVISRLTVTHKANSERRSGKGNGKTSNTRPQLCVRKVCSFLDNMESKCALSKRHQ